MWCHFMTNQASNNRPWLESKAEAKDEVILSNNAGNCQKRQRQSGVRKTFERLKLKMNYFYISWFMLGG